MTRLIIIAALWAMAAFGTLQRDENIEKKYQCSFGLDSYVASIAFAPAIFVIALVADNERAHAPSGCKVEDGKP